MLRQLILDLKLHKGRYLIPVLVLPLCFLFGFGLLYIIMHTTDADTWFCLGTSLTLITLIFCAVILGLYYRSEFMLALSMGRTRGAFMASYAIRTLLWVVSGVAVVIALYRVELTLGGKLFPAYPLEGDPAFLTDWGFVSVLTLCVMLLNMFIGALYSYFGKKALIPLYFIWIAGCIMGPRLSHPEDNTDFLSQTALRLQSFVQTVPDAVWIALGVALLTAMMVTVISLGKKQMVR